MRTIQLMHIKLFTDVLGITQQVTFLKNLLAASPLLLKAILRYLEAHFGIWSSISWKPFNCFTSNFLQIFLVLPWRWPQQIGLFAAFLFLLGAILRYFGGLILVHDSLFLEYHSIASHPTFYRCSWDDSEGYLTKKITQHLLLLWEPFWSILGLILECFVINYRKK